MGFFFENNVSHLGIRPEQTAKKFAMTVGSCAPSVVGSSLEFPVERQMMKMKERSR